MSTKEVDDTVEIGEDECDDDDDENEKSVVKESKPLRGEQLDKAQRLSQLQSTLATEQQSELDLLKSTEALYSLKEKEAAKDAQRKQKQKQLANVKIREEDVVFLRNELQIDESTAIKYLRIGKGDLQETIKNCVVEWPELPNTSVIFNCETYTAH